MTMTLKLRAKPPARVAAGPLTPERLQGLSASDVAALTVRCGHEAVAVGDLFDVYGQAGLHLAIAGDLSLVDELGAGMTRGRMIIEGPCGDRLGAGMSGGEIDVSGDVGAWAGAEMSGGLLRVWGDAGARLGGAYPGFRAGMSGGEIIVSGNAGEETGAGMRRGLIVITGEAGSGAGLRMLAGTVIALGGLGASAGLGNKRGSLVSGTPLQLLPGYAFAARYKPPALRLQLLRARELWLRIDDALINGTWARWSGDRTELGRGEILIFDPKGSR